MLNYQRVQSHWRVWQWDVDHEFFRGIKIGTFEPMASEFSWYRWYRTKETTAIMNHQMDLSIWVTPNLEPFEPHFPIQMAIFLVVKPRFRRTNKPVRCHPLLLVKCPWWSAQNSNPNYRYMIPTFGGQHDGHATWKKSQLPTPLGKEHPWYLPGWLPWLFHGLKKLLG